MPDKITDEERKALTEFLLKLVDDLEGSRIGVDQTSVELYPEHDEIAEVKSGDGTARYKVSNKRAFCIWYHYKVEKGDG